MKAWPTFAKINLDYPQDFWENFLWTHKIKVELFSKVCILLVLSQFRTASIHIVLLPNKRSHHYYPVKDVGLI